MLTPFPHAARVLSSRRTLVRLRRLRPPFAIFGAAYLKRHAAQELEVYARVKIVACVDGYRLVYPGRPVEDGTGPFATRTKAIEFFTRQGR